MGHSKAKKPNFAHLFNDFGTGLKNHTCLNDLIVDGLPSSRNILHFLELIVDEELNLYDEYEKSLKNVLLNRKLIHETSKRIVSMEEESKLFGDVSNFANLYGLKNKNEMENQISAVIKSNLNSLEEAKNLLIKRTDEGDSLMKIYLTALVDYEHKRDQRGKIISTTISIFNKTKETNATSICGLVNNEMREQLLDCSLVRQFIVGVVKGLSPQQTTSTTTTGTSPSKTKTISNIIRPGKKGGLKTLSLDMTKWKRGQQFKVAINSLKSHVGRVFSILDHTSKPLWSYEVPQEGIITSPTLTYTEGGYITYSMNFGTNPGEDLQVVFTAE